MSQDVRKWARAATITALMGLIGGTATAGERPAVKSQWSSHRIVSRAQNSDEELFDAELVDKPRLRSVSEESELGATPSATGEPQSRCTPFFNSTMSPYSGESAPSAAQPMTPFDFGGDSVAGLSSADRVPGMMGDFFGPGFTTCTVVDLSASTVTTITCPDGPSAGLLKLAENSSPIPRDRIFLNYNLFTNVPLNGPDGVNVNRLAPGFEKTFFNGLASFELRMPFATTLDSDITNADLNAQAKNVEFGNVTATWKSYLYNDSRLAVTGGLGLALPTADAISVRLSNGTEAVRFENDAVRLMPFLGSLYTPDDRFFVQSLVQVDAPLNGNQTFLNSDPTNIYGLSSLQDVGTYTPQTYLYFDTALGYWFYNNDAAGAKISGLAGMFEVHYNASLNESDQIVVPLNGYSMLPPLGFAQIGRRDNFSQVNLVVGTTIEFMRSSNLQLGYATTVGGDRVFDGELRCNYTYFFGRNLYGRGFRPGI